MTRPVKTTESKFTFDVLRSDIPVLVDFHAEWCGQCRQLAPVLEELAAEWEGVVKVVTVDVERNEHLSDRYGIRKIPTLVLFSDGEEKARLVEVVRRPGIESGLSGALPQLAQ